MPIIAEAIINAIGWTFLNFLLANNNAASKTIDLILKNANPLFPLFNNTLTNKLIHAEPINATTAGLIPAKIILTSFDSLNC